MLSLMQEEMIVKLSSEDGSILDGSSWENPNVYSKGLILNAPAGSIGIDLEDFDIYTNFNTKDGKLTATADDQ